MRDAVMTTIVAVEFGGTSSVSAIELGPDLLRLNAHGDAYGDQAL
jgi:hypothetical protein